VTFITFFEKLDLSTSIIGSFVLAVGAFICFPLFYNYTWVGNSFYYLKFSIRPVNSLFSISNYYFILYSSSASPCMYASIITASIKLSMKNEPRKTKVMQNTVGRMGIDTFR